jgi:MYXO-CTERM domain-containing protein
MTGVAHGRRIGSHSAVPTARSAMRSTRTLAAAFLAAAMFTGSASAMPADPPHKPGRAGVPTPPPIVETSSGFDWSSAGIGATGGVGAFAIALAGAAGMRRRRTPERRTLVTH